MRLNEEFAVTVTVAFVVVFTAVSAKVYGGVCSNAVVGLPTP